MSDVLPYKLSALVFLRDSQGRFLLIERRKAPNLGCWSPPGGKLEMQTGESPLECAIRETAEETGHRVEPHEMHWFGMIAERGYEGTGHWLMFLYDCRKPLDRLPEGIDEGQFRFFSREEIDAIKLPETDRTLLWPNYDRYHRDFFSMRADCSPDRPLEPVLEAHYQLR